MSKQDATFHCDHCGRLAPVVPGETPYQFEVNCECGRSYSLRWKTSEPPPTFATTSRPPARSDER